MTIQRLPLDNILTIFRFCFQNDSNPALTFKRISETCKLFKLSVNQLSQTIINVITHLPDGKMPLLQSYVEVLKKMSSTAEKSIVDCAQNIFWKQLIKSCKNRVSNFNPYKHILLLENPASTEVQIFNLEIEWSMRQIWMKMFNAIEEANPGCNLPNEIIFYSTQKKREWMNNNKELLNNVEVLNLSQLSLKVVPPEIGLFKGLKKLDLRGNQILFLPDSIGDLSSLEVLMISRNQLKNFPKTIGGLTHLKQLSADHNCLVEIPDSIGELAELTQLSLNHNNLQKLPHTLAGLKALSMLNLEDNQLTLLPKEIGELTALLWLSLENNSLKSLPFEIGNLPCLNYLNVKKNKITVLPSNIQKMSSLKSLIKTENPMVANPFDLKNWKCPSDASSSQM